ncbi:serine hydrolase domain-containing protein [Nocardiopsis sp. LOL_012]|uniref:serine hydrolase domain-containing protein n=1 Tax=Nocardiopsis sp. LOL_012 TaxID=3345409 RepID=UPI003A8940D9
MIPAKTPPPPSRPRRAPTAPVAAAAALALLSAGCAAPAADTPVPAPPAPAAELTRQDVDAWLDGLLPAALDDAGIPGAVVSVVHDGEILTARGYGYADTGADGGDPVPVDPEETLFRVASVSKPVTATAVMGLVQEGELDLDADVNDYLDFTLPAAFDEPVTMRHLLSHTPGFEERLRGMLLAEGVEPDLRGYLVEDPPERVYPPGTVPAYSNYGYALAGYIVERTVGVPFDRYVEETVLGPLGMDSSSFSQPLPGDLSERVASGYTDDRGAAGGPEGMHDAPAGALTASAPDMARFMLAHLGEGGEGFPLSPETLGLMHSPALDTETLGTLAEGPRMALGFFEEDRGGHRVLGHGGDSLYFHSELQIHPEHGTGIFVSLNGGGYAGIDSLNLRRAVADGFVDRYLPQEHTPRTGTDTAAEHAAAAAGTYTSSRTPHSTFLSVIGAFGATQVVDRGDGTILLAPGPETGAPAVYEETEPWVWREVGGQGTLTMRVDGGRVSAIGTGPASALLPAAPGTALALPVLVSSALVLLVAAVSWPIRALARRLSERSARDRTARDRTARTVRVLTRVGAACALAALLGWVAVIVSLTGLRDVPAAVLRVLQVLQLFGALAVVPAAWGTVDGLRRRAGWRRWTGAAMILVALLGVLWFACAFGLLSLDVSY